MTNRELGSVIPFFCAGRWRAKQDVFRRRRSSGSRRSLLLKIAIEIVDFPMNSMVIFNSYVSLPEGIYDVVYL